MNAVYQFTNEEIQETYLKILDQGEKLEVEANYQNEIALLVAYINYASNFCATDDDSQFYDLKRWDSVMRAITLKKELIKDQRLERDRTTRAEEARKKVDSVPIDDYRDAVNKILLILQEYVPPEIMMVIMSRTSEISVQLNAKKK